MNVKFRAVWFCLVSLLLLSQAACVPTSELYHGKQIPSGQNETVLQEGSYQGTFETFDISMTYEYLLNGEVLELSGNLALGRHYQRLYTRLQNLRVYLFILDHDSLVSKTVPLLDIASAATEEAFEFKQLIKVPAGSKALAFGYLGKVSELEGTANFYQLPRP